MNVWERVYRMSDLIKSGWKYFLLRRRWKGVNKVKGSYKSSSREKCFSPSSSEVRQSSQPSWTVVITTQLIAGRMFAEKFHTFRHIMAAHVCVCVSFMAVRTTNVQRCPPRTLPRRSRCCGGTRWTSWWTSCCPCPPFRRAQSSRCVCWLSSWSGACRAGSAEAKGQTGLIFIDSLRFLGEKQKNKTL